MRIPNATSLNVLPTDGRPQAHLSNWPTPLSSDNWAFIFAQIYFATMTSASLLLFIRYTYYRHHYPVNLQFYPLIAVSILSHIWLSVAYTHNLIFPNLPCWLHIWVTTAPYFPYAVAGTSSTLRIYLLYNAQFYMAKGEHDNWFVKKKHILKGVYIEVFMTLVVLLISSATILARLLGVQDSEDLRLPMWQLRCSSLTTTQVTRERKELSSISWFAF